MWRVYITLICVFVVTPFVYLTFKFRNPFKCVMVVGAPGSGKTTLMVKLAQKHLRSGWTVYSDTPIPGAYLIDPSDLGQFMQSEKAVVFLDEIGMTFDNRQFKSFQNYTRDYFKLHRHHQHKIFMFSQSFDVDIKIRSITDKIYLLVNYFGWFSVAKEIKTKWVAVQPTDKSEGRLAQAMLVSPFLLAPFGARMYTFIPRWTKYFNSFELPDLPTKQYKFIEYPEGFYQDKKGHVHFSPKKKK